MDRGRNYHSLIQEKEQLLAKLKNLEIEIKSSTNDFFEENSSNRKSSTQKDNNPKNEFGVLITDENSQNLLVSDPGLFQEEKISYNNSDNKQGIVKAGNPVRSKGSLNYKGKTYHLEFIKTPLLIDNQFSKILTLVRDISTKYISEQSEIQELIFNTSDDFVVIKDLNQKIIIANKAYLEAIGRKNLNEIIGLQEQDFIKHHKSEKEDLIALKLKKGESIESEGEFILGDGSTIDTLVKRFPIYNGDVLIATASIYRDITSLKNEHRKLLRSEEKYRMIIENQGEGACILDSYDNFIFANSAAEKLFETKRHGLIDRSLNEFLKEPDYNIIKNKFNRTDTVQTQSFEFEIISLRNTKKYVLLTISPFFNDNGYLVGSFILFRDITERRQIEDELLRSELSLKETVATKDKFFSIIAHDLKNPFGSIMGFSELILRKLSPTNLDKIQHYARIIHSASKHGFELLENLLAWSRSQNGTLKYSPNNISLNEIITNNINILKESAENKQHKIEYLNPKDFNVFIDEDMINTVFRNILSNAIKYSNPLSTITISANKTDNSFVEIAVEDKGVGMNKKHLEQLFSIDSNKSIPGTNGEQGTGLGLILSKEFIEKNKGNIWAESAIGKGSTFYFTLPLSN